MAKTMMPSSERIKMLHQPGKGFLDGYNDRKNSIPNKALLNLENNDAYWREYDLGWKEAHRQLVENNGSDGRDLLLG